MVQPSARIVYTRTDEAPLLATYSLLPVIAAYAAKAGVDVESRDISLAGRILALFPERLTEDQQVADALAELGELAKSPEANIIKLPNVSASIPQLKAAVRELQQQGFDLPDYPDDPQSDEDRSVRARYDKVKGSAVNPVLREGNSDRRAPLSVKNYARKHPHSMGAWSSDSKTNVAHMEADDFRSNEKSVVIPADTSLRITLVDDAGAETVLRESVPVLAGEVVDSTVMRVAALQAFLTAQIARAKAEDVLLSVHLKATMMKVSDPIIFGHAVKAFLPEVFETYGPTLAAAGLSPNDGLGGILAGLDALPEGAEIKAAIDRGLADGPALAMVDSDRGITNLHVPSDIIVDASMPAMIRTSGHMWGPDGQEADTLAVLPDSSYAGIYQVVIDDCRAHGAYDPSTMGSVSNVGLMAQAAEEYGSHDKTFEIGVAGTVRVTDSAGDGRAGAPGGTGRHLADVPDQGRTDPRLDQAGRQPRPGDRAAGRLLARRVAGARRQPDRQDQRDAARARHHRSGHLDPRAGEGDRLLAGADPARGGHHLGDRQRAPRLPDRSVPDPGAGHVGQDAVGGAVDQRGRAVRDRRRWFGAQARAAAGQGELPALGQPGRVPGPGRVAGAPGPDHRTTSGRRCWPTRWIGRPGPSWTRTSHRRAGSARSTTGGRTSTWRCSGRRSWPRRPRTPSWRPTSGLSRPSCGSRRR